MVRQRGSHPLIAGSTPVPASFGYGCVPQGLLDWTYNPRSAANDSRWGFESPRIRHIRNNIGG